MNTMLEISGMGERVLLTRDDDTSDSPLLAVGRQQTDELLV